ncbi:triose-phosphate isomerase [Streptococcus massiliensis]|uniref:Triosephosphate isomerase n=1 Tax=Streptococcus massiliensis TaxID=313439 RepID=A0A380KY90_9STRE|nr:triose-phosphate isomerase [Streptococcus massiliensis]SUN76595.1 triose-phosphate isomerase [Streptococcus massiliensis]
MLAIFNFKNKMSIATQEKLMDEFNTKNLNKNHQLIVAPIVPRKDSTYQFNVAIQNLAIKGRNVGDLSPQHLEHFGIKYAFVGHLERQSMLNEDVTMIQSKIENAISHKVVPIACLGIQNDVSKELREILAGLDLQNAEIIFAYEILTATLRGQKDYSFTEIARNFTKLKDYLEGLSHEFSNFSYKLIFGGGIEKEHIEKVMHIGFDGVLVGDRIPALKSVYHYLESDV